LYFCYRPNNVVGKYKAYTARPLVELSPVALPAKLQTACDTEYHVCFNFFNRFKFITGCHINSMYKLYRTKCTLMTRLQFVCDVLYLVYELWLWLLNNYNDGKGLCTSVGCVNCILHYVVCDRWRFGRFVKLRTY